MGRAIAIIIPVLIIAGAITIATSSRLQTATAKNETLAQKVQTLESQLNEADSVRADLDKKLAQISADAATNQKRLADLEAQLVDAKRQVEKAKSKRIADLEDADWETKTQAEAKPEKQQKKKGFGAMIENMFKDENMKKMMRQQQMAMLDTTYGALFKRLGLTGDKLKDFKALLVERQMGGAERGMDFLTVGNDKEKMAALVDELKLEREAADAEIAALLDPNEYEAYKTYEQTVGERMMVSQLANKLQAAGEPLTEDQNEQLIMLMHDNNKTHLGEGFTQNDPGQAMKSMQTEAGINDVISKMDAANAALLEQSEAILSPTQHEAFSKHQRQQAQMQKMGMQMMKTMMKSDDGENDVQAIPGGIDFQVQPAP